MMIDIKDILESRWHHTLDGDVVGKKKLAEMRVWFIVGFCTGLRGEELHLIELAGTRNSFDLLDGLEKYFKVVLS